MADFDWVKARAECTVAPVFVRLCNEIEADVAKRQELSGTEKYYGFKVNRELNSLIVSVQGFGKINDVIQFIRTETAIVVKDAAGATLHTATLTLDDEGQCKLRVGTASLDTWQFRKLALEEFFFRPELKLGAFD